MMALVLKDGIVATNFLPKCFAFLNGIPIESSSLRS